MFEKILIPVDGSRHARCAVESAIELAQSHGSTVYLLHVIRDLSLPKEILAMIRASKVTVALGDPARFRRHHPGQRP